MADAPVTSPYRRHLEAIIRIIDVIGYLAVIGMGVFATFASPGSVGKFLLQGGWSWVAGVWCALLLIGGIGGAVGRITRFGLFEIPANTAALFGVLIYAVIITGLALVEPEAWVAAFAMLFVVGAVFRRGVELSIFYSDPGGKKSFWDWVNEARSRRTPNFIQRSRD